MTGNMKSLSAPILIITIGLGWLLTVHDIVPGVNWIWTLGLAVAGLLILAVGGIDKVTFVIGPFLIASTFFSLMRQTGRLYVDTEVPSLVIVFGTLMLLARLLPIPIPTWIVEPEKARLAEAKTAPSS
jgi:hypothetical protein